jgi:tetratricopeptide (TPR) repeat protein
LADYFHLRETDNRKADELPWQLSKAEEWERLKNCLADLPMFSLLNTESKKYELSGYWRLLENRYDIVDSYGAALEHFEITGATEDILANYLHSVASFFDLNAKYAGAEPLYRRALTIHEKMLGSDHPNTAGSVNSLAGLLYAKGDFDGAEPLYRKALATCEKVLGPAHPDTAGSVNNLAMLLQAKGDIDGAEPLFRRAMAIFEKVLGPEHPNTATCVNNLARLLIIKGD